MGCVEAEFQRLAKASLARRKSAGGVRRARAVCSIVIVKTKPNKVATTLCTSQSGLGALLLRHNVPNKRVGGATRIRGCPNFGSVLNPRLTRQVCRDAVRFKTRRICNSMGQVIISNSCHVIRTNGGACGAHTIVVTAKSCRQGLNIPNRTRCGNHNISCYTIYSKTFFGNGGLTIINNKSSTIRRKACLARFTSIGVIREQSRLQTRGIVRSHTFGGRGISFA